MRLFLQTNLEFRVFKQIHHKPQTLLDKINTLYKICIWKTREYYWRKTFQTNKSTNGFS